MLREKRQSLWKLGAASMSSLLSELGYILVVVQPGISIISLALIYPF
jgi:hypothetical protein